jgi:hypothetical protein
VFDGRGRGRLCAIKSMSFNQYIDWIKLSPKYLMAIAMIATSLILLPVDVTNKLGVAEFVSKFRMWIGFICIVSYGLLLTHILWATKEFLMGIWQQRALLKAGRVRLRNLTPGEKRLLADYVIYKTRSRKLDYQSGVVHGLQNENIIYQSSPLGSMQDGFAFNLCPWAWEELEAHSEILEPELSVRCREIKNA